MKHLSLFSAPFFSPANRVSESDWLPVSHWEALRVTSRPDSQEGLAAKLLHCVLSLMVQCIVIGPVCLQRAGVVCLWLCGSVTMITQNCVHRSSPNWVCR